MGAGGEAKVPSAEFLALVSGLVIEVKEIVGRGDVEVEEVEEEAVAEVHFQFQATVWMEAVGAENAVGAASAIG
jgi:hypothetical protein